MMEITKVPLDSILEPAVQLRPVNPRVVAELAKSIAGSGLLQPVMVKPSNGKYALVFGFHRVLACRSLGWTEMPAIVKDMSPEEVLLSQIVENIQRNTAMNVLEEGRAYKHLMKQGWTVSKISATIGKSDSYVLDRVRTVDRLRPDIATEATLNPQLTASHAIRIAYIRDQNEQLELSRLVKSQKLSVRELERIIALYRSANGSEIGLAELLRRFKTYNLERWNDGVFPGPDGRVVVLRAETFSTVVGGLGDKSYLTGLVCGRNTARRIRLRNLNKRIDDFNIRSGWGVLSITGGAVELRNPVVRDLEFIRGYLGGLLSLNLRTVISNEEKIVLRVVRPHAFDGRVAYSTHSI